MLGKRLVKRLILASQRVPRFRARGSYSGLGAAEATPEAPARDAAEAPAQAPAEPAVRPAAEAPAQAPAAEAPAQAPAAEAPAQAPAEPPFARSEVEFRDHENLCENTWETERDATGIQVNWQFTTADARIKLRRLYPSIDG